MRVSLSRFLLHLFRRYILVTVWSESGNVPRAAAAVQSVVTSWPFLEKESPDLIPGPHETDKSDSESWWHDRRSVTRALFLSGNEPVCEVESRLAALGGWNVRRAECRCVCRGWVAERCPAAGPATETPEQWALRTEDCSAMQDVPRF